MLALVALLQLQAPASTPYPADSLPLVTLGEALRRATGLDPNYVAALGQVDNAQWARRSAFSVFILPSITLNADVARPNPQSINFVTFLPVRQQVTAQVTAPSSVWSKLHASAVATPADFVRNNCVRPYGEGDTSSSSDMGMTPGMTPGEASKTPVRVAGCIAACTSKVSF